MDRRLICRGGVCVKAGSCSRRMIDGAWWAALPGCGCCYRTQAADGDSHIHHPYHTDLHMPGSFTRDCSKQQQQQQQQAARQPKGATKLAKLYFYPLCVPDTNRASDANERRRFDGTSRPTPSPRPSQAARAHCVRPHFLHPIPPKLVSPLVGELDGMNE